MKAIIIDDERKAQNLMEALLQQNCSEVNSILKASNLLEGIQIIKETQPDIVFLDIDMPQHSGLEILDFFDNQPIDFQIIFVTAYNQYAVEAFKLSAIDYLLKPVDVQELITAVNKAQHIIENKSINNQISDLKQAFKQLAINKVALEIPKGIIFAAEDDILYFEADGMYTKVHLLNNRTELICKPLKHFVSQLESKVSFYKPHRSYLINLKHINELSKKDGFHLIMENNKSIPVSKDKKEEFMQIIAEVF